VENAVRSAMHPARQFEPFAKLHREENIAVEGSGIHVAP
jgi:hypothetical protein